MQSKTFLSKAWRCNQHTYTEQGGHRTTATRDEFNKKFFKHPKGGMFTVNGFVAHIDHGYECEFEEWNRPDIEVLTKDKELFATLEVSKLHFLRACKAARSVRPKTLRIHINGAMEVEAENHAIGRAYCAISNKHVWKIKNKDVPVHYEKLGIDRRIEIDPMYLINAVQGMDNIFEIEVYDNMIVLKSEKREAIIMLFRDDREA